MDKSSPSMNQQMLLPIHSIARINTQKNAPSRGVKKAKLLANPKPNWPAVTPVELRPGLSDLGRQSKVGR
jgi:hypothetical protein